MLRQTLNNRVCQRTFHCSMRMWSKGGKVIALCFYAILILMRGCVTAKDEDAVQTAKKYVGKIHEEEKSKEPHPSPISQKSREKYSEMEKKTQEHDEKKSQK